MRTRLVGKHKKDCWALKDVKDGTRKHPWKSSGYCRAWRDSLGRYNAKGRTTRWFRFFCLCGACDADILINVDDILDAATEEAG